MAYKIHKRGAFVIIENTVNGEIKELNSQFVQITKGKTSLDQYEVLYNGVSQLKAVLGDIQDANGVAYVEADWDIFRYEQCGSVNSSEVANPYPAPTVATVDITSAQILAMGTTPIELLPAPGAGMYYDVEKVVLEYTASTQYTTTSRIAFDGALTAFVNTPLSSATNRIVNVSTNSVEKFTVYGEDMWSFYNLPINRELALRAIGGVNPTGGDGTLRAIITYTVRTFGA